MFALCAYKESEYLEECIQSLLNQKLKSPIVVITSTPNDYIKALCAKYQLELVINEGQGGIAQDWNFGIHQCRSKYVTIAHQDDTYEPDYAASVLEKIESSDDPIIAFTNYGEIRNGIIVDDSQLVGIKRKLLIPLKFKCFAKNKFVRRRVLGLGNAICCPSVTYCMDKLDEPIFEVGLKSNLDWETWERISKTNGSFIYVPQILMHHRIHEESTTSELIRNNKRGEEDYQVFRKFWPAFIAKLLTKFYSRGEKLNDV